MPYRGMLAAVDAEVDDSGDGAILAPAVGERTKAAHAATTVNRKLMV